MESRLIFLRLLYTKRDGEPWWLRADGSAR
jgi:hypothetical protein